MVSASTAGNGAYRHDFLAAIDACLSIRASERPQSIHHLRPLLLKKGAPPSTRITPSDPVLRKEGDRPPQITKADRNVRHASNTQRRGWFGWRQSKVSKVLNCSFCGKRKSEVRELFAGIDGFICNECVLLLVQIQTPELDDTINSWCSHGFIHYQLAADDLARNLIRAVLKRVERYGLPGRHHMYIVFQMNTSGLVVPQRLRDRFPEGK